MVIYCIKTYPIKRTNAFITTIALPTVSPVNGIRGDYEEKKNINLLNNYYTNYFQGFITGKMQFIFQKIQSFRNKVDNRDRPSSGRTNRSVNNFAAA